ncbi:hypothetical protein CTAYLR_010464 [Chrysophaeum taylorii]|uniref:Tudor-knot domain-containing protein n=1 Tax=Chrysophaeum taylorii TaxID=2483200 RepID=A0AAD7U5V0_9STRA|nr:hypothetical protein CTAYLR_010464 [Chrysophaeum taylorii]
MINNTFEPSGASCAVASAMEDEEMRESACAAAQLRLAITRLTKSTSAAEVRTALQRVLREMEVCDTRALGLCRADLDAAVPDRVGGGRFKHSCTAWTRENRAFFVSMLVHFYRGDRLTLLPREVACGAVLAFCDVPALAALASASRGARRIADSDATWRSPYDRHFGTSKAGIRYDYGASLKESYHQRIRDPTCGDRVEVAWQGRFRLEGLEVYRGLAWWAAEVAEKRTDEDVLGTSDDDDPSAASPNSLSAEGGRATPRSTRGTSSRSLGATSPTNKRYKVHYLNWDSRWDEWVSRDQLRWPVQEGKTCAISPGDDVEVWCSGNTVPGAWLRAVVDRVDDELFCVGNVASSGHLWVSRDRVRLVRRCAETDPAALRRARVALPSCLAGPVQKLKDFWRVSQRGRNALGCVFAPFVASPATTTAAPPQPPTQQGVAGPAFVAAARI